MKKNLKFLILGGGDIGKTSLYTQFVQNHFDEKAQASQVEQRGIKTIQIDDQFYSIELCDVDLESFMDLTEYYLKDSDGIIFSYSIVSNESFTVVPWIYNQISRALLNVPRILVGLQCDMEAKRKISVFDGLQLGTSQRFFVFLHIIFPIILFIFIIYTHHFLIILFILIIYIYHFTKI